MPIKAEDERLQKGQNKQVQEQDKVNKNNATLGNTEVDVQKTEKNKTEACN